MFPRPMEPRQSPPLGHFKTRYIRTVLMGFWQRQSEPHSHTFPEGRLDDFRRESRRRELLDVGLRQ
jgi:hypothetical protein